VSRPNLFSCATSELSQDTVLCWLAEWAKPEHCDTDPMLHRLGTEFLRLLLAGHELELPQAIDSLEVKRQHRNIDVLIVVNDTVAICIEDKVGTKEHSKQLERYVRLLMEGGLTENHIVRVYIQTGEQGDYNNVKAAGYSILLRANIIDLFSRNEVDNNAIARDFHDHLRKVEENVRAFNRLPLQEWNRYAWQGFYSELQSELGYGNWDDVANPSGGFLGYWWHWHEDVTSKQYLQLEESKLCFKIQVDDATMRGNLRSHWSERILAAAGPADLKVIRPQRFRASLAMTVALLEGEYRMMNTGGSLDIVGTVEVLRQAEAILERATRSGVGQTVGVDRDTNGIFRVDVNGRPLDHTSHATRRKCRLGKGSKMGAEADHSIPRRMRQRYEAVTGITDEFCRQHLNDEYAEQSRKMAAALCEEEPSPLESGRERSWAAGIVYALGRVNFLSDNSWEPHMTMSELCVKIGVSQGNASSKSREIWKRLGLMQLHPDWCLPSMLDENPLAWMLEVNGLPVDVRAMPREVQEEAYRLGLIPYIP
jgi:hypothetical protein